MGSRSDPDRPALSLFAEELRAARERAGMSREDLAAKISYSASLIGMVESCRRVPQAQFAASCDEALGMPGTFARIQKRLRTLSFPESFRPFAEHEAAATSLRTFEHSLVPGLLQTAGYARAVLATRPNTTEDEVEDLVAARLERQAVLDRDSPPLLWSVTDEAVLHRPVGGKEVMRAQLLHLAEMADRPNVTVQVIPYSAGAHSGLLGAFVIADFGGAPGIAYLETAAEGETVEEPSVVAQVALIFDTLRSEALPRTASRDLILKVAEERWT
ncbi:MAG TPA: helix-turn-helix transcriptional regulator [Streptosporangiaceae bacterium]|nr:helix-turn-helix transcriptional regulator [Streptosporangiaceae bacterium]